MEETKINKAYIIDILQLYKTALTKEVGKSLHLIWKDKKIDWCEAQKSEHHFRRCKEDELMKKFAGMNNTIEPGDKQMARLTVQYAAGIVRRVTEEWLSKLNPRGAEVLFYTYINHDYEYKFKRFRGLSETQTAAKMNISTYTVWKEKRDAVQKILEFLEQGGRKKI